MKPATEAETQAASQPRAIDALARKLVERQLSQMQHGAITIDNGDGSARFGKGSPHATLRVLDPRFYSSIAFGGSVGAGEAWMDSYWQTDDLTALLRIILRNRELMDGMEKGWARLAVPMQKALHWAARNTPTGSRRNIAAHYDVGNDFYRLWLDPTMMYSSAVFERDDMTLEQASTAKLDLICRKLRLTANDHVMEIGTGWGGFALHAAGRYGCRVTTTTISQQQYDVACERIAAAGLSDRITVLFKDYRDLQGQYDKLVSIEMIEAVGHHYFDAYFRKCSELLKPDGLMLLQAITIADQQYMSARNSVDFIKRYIFPGCCIPANAVICDALARVTDLNLVHLEDIGLHYARTLHCWHDGVVAHIDEIRALGYTDRFIRMWQFYLCYCEAGFAERALGDVQMLLAKPRALVTV